MGSVGQRVSKLLAVKVGGLKKKSAYLPWPHSNHLAQILLRPGSNHSKNLTASNFEAFRPTDFISTAIKDLNLLKKHIKNQEAGSIFKVFFALSRGPHFHKAYLLTARK